MGRPTAIRAVSGSRPELDDLTLRRAQQGDRVALEALVERYHPMVHALVWRMACARGESHVADLVQDCLVRVLQGLGRFNPVGPARLSTWIMTIATRVVLNDRRRIDPRDARLDPAGYIDPATAASERELGVVLAKAITELPEPQRVVLVLREYHDLDYGEIAQVLDLDLNTVKSRMSRARVAVREAMARSLPDLFRGAR